MLNSSQTVDFGVFPREDGEQGRLILEIREDGRFTMSHMVTPDEGTLVGGGEFKSYIKGLPQLAIDQMVKITTGKTKTKPSVPTTEVLSI